MNGVCVCVYGLSLRLRSPEDGPQVRLHSVTSSVDRLVAEGALLVAHLLRNLTVAYDGCERILKIISEEEKYFSSSIFAIRT